MTKSQAGKLGGLSTYKKYGRCHMQAIGKAGAKATWKLYKLMPYRQTEYAMVNRETNVIVAIWR